MFIMWLRVCRHHSFSLGKNPQDSPTSRGEQVCLFFGVFLSMFFQPQHYNVLSQIIILLCMIRCLMANTFTTWCKELTHWKKPWSWERLKAGGEGDDRGKDGWMASLTHRTWVWANSGGWWWTGRPGMLQSMESQRVGHGWATELNWSCLTHYCLFDLITKLCLTLLRPHELSPARLLCAWHPPGKYIGVDCIFLLQGIFLTQGSNPCLLHWQEDSLPLSHWGNLNY